MIDDLSPLLPNNSTKGLSAEFLTRPVLQTYASEEKGEEVYAEVTYIKIYKSGSASGEPIFFQPASDENKARFQHAYSLFTNNKDHIVDEKLHLDHLKGLNPVHLEILKKMRVTNIKVLSEVADQDIKKIGQNGLAIKRAAIEYMEKYKVTRIIKDHIAEKDAEIEKLKKENAELVNKPKKTRKPNKTKVIKEVVEDDVIIDSTESSEKDDTV